ncbi:hypothetical protein VTN00DRAFT_7934 [Thermoascus crustaceus]|uniref:uncharacterized protein n=1 Tax=Thermoascus crustaceus TaxID=5088 RepID=UPI003743C931
MTQFAVFGVPLTPPHDQPAACWGSASHGMNQTIGSSSLPSQLPQAQTLPVHGPPGSPPVGECATVVNPGRATRSSDGAGAAAAALVLHASPSPPGPPSYPKQRLLSNSVQSIYYSGLCILRIIQTHLTSVLLASQLAVLVVPKVSPDSAAAGVPRLYTGYAISNLHRGYYKERPLLNRGPTRIRSGKHAVPLYQGIPPVSRELPRGRVIRSGTFHQGLENGPLI